jgi:TorA maturation chaperone TorD
MELTQIIEKVQQHHPEFTYDEIAEVCFDYLADFSDKVKEETKEKSLKRYLNREF